jgi:AcrR family transcriptional regulator
LAQPKRSAATRSALQDLVRPPKRADARGNYMALLAAADEVFTSHGPDAPLDEIARRAGVGNATLYRHFPTRRDLLVAVCVDEVEALCSLGERLESHAPAGDALTQWLRAYIDHVSSKNGLAAAFATGRREDSELVASCQAAITAVGTALLRRAQLEGAVRSSVGLQDLITLVNAIAMATESGGRGEANRLLTLVLEGVSSAPARGPQR